MPRGVHHVTVATSEFDRVRRFLHDVLEMEGEIPLPKSTDARQSAGRRALAEVSGWPQGPPTEGVMIGTAPFGRVELFEAEADGSPERSGLLVLSFAVPHLDKTVARCREAGVTVSDTIAISAGAHDFTVAFARVGSLTFELITFEGSTARTPLQD